MSASAAGFGPASRTILVLAAFVIIIAGMKAAAPMLVPFLLAVFIATIAEGPVSWLTKRRVPGGLAIALVILAMIIILTGIGALIARSVAGFTTQLPFYQARLTDIATGLVNWFTPFAANLGFSMSTDAFLQHFDPAVALDMVRTTLSSLGGVLSNSFLILLTVVFMLAEASSLPAKLTIALADGGSRTHRFRDFGSTVNHYVGIKTTISAATGIIVTLGLTLLNVDFPMLWGLLAFLLNFVPTIGSIIAAIPPVLLALVQLGPFEASLVGAGFLGLNVLMGSVIETRMMGRGLGLSTLVVFLSLVFWGWVLGPIGMLLSIPLTMTAKMALDAGATTHWLAVLLGPAPGPGDIGTAEPPHSTTPEATPETTPETPGR